MPSLNDVRSPLPELFRRQRSSDRALGAARAAVATRPCSSSTPAWSRSRTSSPAPRPRRHPAPRPRRSASAPAASTTTWTTSATPAATRPSSRCWAISPSATTSRKRRSSWRGGSSAATSALPRDRLIVSIHPQDEDAAGLWQQDRRLQRRPDRAPGRRTSGPWATPARADPCTEIFYDHGEHVPGGPPGSAGRGRRAVRGDLEPRLHAVGAARRRDASRPAPAADRHRHGARAGHHRAAGRSLQL